MPRPTLRTGSFGSDVALVQRHLACAPDGAFGPATETAVIAFQRGADLSADGIVGEQTWKALARSFHLPPYPPAILPPLTSATMTRIKGLAKSSDLASYSWKNRGKAPLGYIQGMTFAYATLYRKFVRNDQAVVGFLSRPSNGNRESTDALDWYAERFFALRMTNSRGGVDTLRHLLTLQLGLGMRESSGKYCEGRDQAATNTTSDTCEAGLFQMSWNASACTTDIQRCFDEYTDIRSAGANNPDAIQQTALELFSQNVTCSAANWANYGSGQGRDFQDLAKNVPQFAVESTSYTLRFLRKHYGPINRREVELLSSADELLTSVQSIIDQDDPILVG